MLLPKLTNQLQMHLAHGNEFFHAGGVGRGTQLSVFPFPNLNAWSQTLPRWWDEAWERSC